MRHTYSWYIVKKRVGLLYNMYIVGMYVQYVVKIKKNKKREIKITKEKGELKLKLELELELRWECG